MRQDIPKPSIYIITSNDTQALEYDLCDMLKGIGFTCEVQGIGFLKTVEFISGPYFLIIDKSVLLKKESKILKSVSNLIVVSPTPYNPAERLAASSINAHLCRYNDFSIATIIKDSMATKASKLIHIIDDSRIDAMRLTKLLEKEGYQTEVFLSAPEALEALNNTTPDLYLVDLKMPYIDGEVFIRALRQYRRLKATPIVIVSSGNDKVLKLAAMESSADDFIQKPAEAKELSTVVKYHLGHAASVHNLINIDALTNCYNRQYLLERLESAYLVGPGKYTIAILDIDHFKSVNDDFGHGVGDEILKGLSAYILMNIRSSDVFARYGGEEFILLMAANYETGNKVIDRLRDGFSKLMHSAPGHRNITCTFSAGSASLEEADGNKIIDIIDKRLYQAKANGRNQLVTSG